MLHFHLQSLELCLGGIIPPKPPRGDGTEPVNCF